MRDFKELLAWQLADTLRAEIVEFTETGPTARDFRYRDQIRDAGASPPRNIAEGFGRYHPSEFARFLEFAIASYEEIKDALVDGLNRGYLDDKRCTRLRNLAGAAENVAKKLLRAKRRQAAKNAERRDTRSGDRSSAARSKKRTP